MTRLLTVRDVWRPRAFCADLLGGREVMEENPCIVRLANCWVIMNPRGGSTPDRAHVPTARLDGGAGFRCSVRDPDGELIEVGQAAGLVEGRLVGQAPVGSEAGRADGR
jgi:hypothetical protein